MILEINHLDKLYGQHLVLNDINLRINEPRLIALVAPNGSGKSTLMNILANLEKPSSGFARVLSKKTTNFEIFKEMTYLQDNSVLYDDLSGWDHIRLICSMYGVSKTDLLDVIDNLEMNGYLKKRVRFYSLGMKQHLLFAMAILPKPRLLLLDEPLNGLDPASIRKVRHYLLKMHKEGTTALLSSHNLEQIDKITRDIYFK